jgi:hypothetical protein
LQLEALFTDGINVKAHYPQDMMKFNDKDLISLAVAG